MFHYRTFFNFVTIYRDFHRKGAKNAKKFARISKKNFALLTAYPTGTMSRFDY